MKKRKSVRQGDLWFSPVTTKKTKKPQKGVVFAYGEVTGHQHQTFSDVSVIEIENTGLPKLVTLVGEVVHEEHKPVKLVGSYRVRRKNEYDPYEKTMRRVVD